MDISVIIPSYNRAHLLARAIESVLSQDLAPREIIVVDDGSSDDTRELMSNRFPQCQYIHQPNQGVSSARNRGIEAASGEWLAFLDSDDEWLPGKLAAQSSTLKNQPGLLICHTEEIWIRNGRRVNAMKKHRKSGGRIFRNCLPLCVISPSSAMIHRSLLTEVGNFDENLPVCEDYDMWLRICAHQPVAFVAEAQIIKYGGHEDQLSRQEWGMDRFRLQALEKIINTGGLIPDDHQAAIETLLAKADILANGAEKRHNTERRDYYLKIQETYRTLL
jgi:glycosyltransferase involved in cell wall biosynthesis